MTTDDLYTASPDRFVAAREEAVARAKAAGDTAQASAIAKLRKPTVAAWVINLLALKRPDLVKDLADLSTALREAQRELKGAQLKQLAAQRRSVVNSLVEQARELAIEAQPNVKVPVTELEATFNAALADEAVAAEIRAGRLLKTTSYAGFGEMPIVDTGPDKQEEARKAEAELEVERTAAAEMQAAAELDEIEDALAELRQRRQIAFEELSQRKAAHTAAQRALAALRRR